MQYPPDQCVERARALHDEALVIDTHCDTTQKLLDHRWNFTQRHDSGHLDLPRAIEGGLNAAFFAIWAAGPLTHGQGASATQKQLNAIISLTNAHPDKLAFATTPDAILQAHKTGRFAVVPAIEGGYLIEESLELLSSLHKQGAAYMTLTHGFHTAWADSAGIHVPLPPRHGGLTEFGKTVVREMNDIGLMVDVSHASDDTVRDALNVSKAPLIATHSSCRAVSPHIRNLPDELIQEIANHGGVVQINFATGFIDPNYPKINPQVLQQRIQRGDLTAAPPTNHQTPMGVLADHFDHAIKLVGPNHVGIGTDFDGVPQLPEGLGDVSKLPFLTAELMRRGYNEAELTPVLGLNVVRVLEACQHPTRGSMPEPDKGQYPIRANTQ